MRCDGLRFLRRAAWKHLPNRFGHSHRENLILFVAIDLGPLAPDTALLSIGGTLCLGLLHCRFFDQISLAFVALASHAKEYQYRAKCAVLTCPSIHSAV